MIQRELELSPKIEEEEVKACYSVDPKEDEDR